MRMRFRVWKCIRIYECMCVCVFVWESVCRGVSHACSRADHEEEQQHRMQHWLFAFMVVKHTMRTVTRYKDNKEDSNILIHGQGHFYFTLEDSRQYYNIWSQPLAHSLCNFKQNNNLFKCHHGRSHMPFPYYATLRKKFPPSRSSLNCFRLLLPIIWPNFGLSHSTFCHLQHTHNL